MNDPPNLADLEALADEAERFARLNPLAFQAEIAALANRVVPILARYDAIAKRISKAFQRMKNKASNE